MMGMFSSGSQFLSTRRLGIALGLLIVTQLCGCNGEEKVVALIRVSSRGLSQDRSEVLMQTQIALLSSPFVLEAAMRNDGLADLPIFKDVEQPACWIEDRLEVAQVNNSELIKISLRARSTDDAVQIVNAVMDAYLEEIAVSGRRERVERLELLRKTLKENFDEVREVIDAIHMHASSQGPQDELYQALALEEAKQLVARISALEAQQVEAEIDLRLASADDPLVDPLAALPSETAAPRDIDARSPTEEDDEITDANSGDTATADAGASDPDGGDPDAGDDEALDTESLGVELDAVLTERASESRPRPAEPTAQISTAYAEAKRRHEVIGDILLEERAKLTEVMAPLAATQSAPELLIQKDRLNGLLARVADLEQEIHEEEMKLQEPNSIYRVQPATKALGDEFCK